MANVEIKNPRFYCDVVSSHIAKGISQNNEFFVKVITDSNPSLTTLDVQSGSAAELFDGKPLNQVTFNTTSNTSSHVLINIDSQEPAGSGSTSERINFIAILNHNMKSADSKVRIFGGAHANDIESIDAGGAETLDIDWSTVTTAQVVNADAINVGAGNTSVVIEPAQDGSTVFTFDGQNDIYWAIQFEGTNSDSSANATDGTFDGSNDLRIGCIMVGTYYDMPHSPDMTLARSISFDKNKIFESMGGQKYGLATNLGRHVSSTSRSPFLVGTQSAVDDVFFGRIAYDFAFSYIQDTDLLPAEYVDVDALHTSTTRSFVMDVWNNTLGNLLPFIFSVDNTSTGANAESELIFARFDSNTLDMKQIAHKLYNIRLKITEEF